MAWSSGNRLGKYEIVERLAAGGMAEVYLAKVIGLAGFSRPIAIKRILPHLMDEPGFREMFLQEAAIAARLNHPHVVQVLDFAEEAGELYLAMEFVHGVSLKCLHSYSLEKHSAERNPALLIHPLLAAHICRCIAQALDHAWTATDEQGNALHLIHRDVSPHNILLSYQGGAKLADFGIAKPAHENTSVGTVKGKLRYMSPEQMMGDPLDARTDVYSLGIVLYETALNLQNPLFDGGSQESVLYAIQSRKVAPPVRVQPGFPQQLSAVIMQSLERDPKKRFASAAEFADALGKCIHREATGPEDYDLPAFMRRLYGDIPSIGELIASLGSRSSFQSLPALPATEALPCKENAILNKSNAGNGSNITNTLPLESINHQHASPFLKRKLLTIILVITLTILSGTLIAILVINWKTKTADAGFDLPKPTISTPSQKPSPSVQPVISPSIPPSSISATSTTLPSNPSPSEQQPSAIVNKNSHINNTTTETASTDNNKISTNHVSQPTNKIRTKLKTGILKIDLRPRGWGIISIDREPFRQVEIPYWEKKLTTGKHVIHYQTSTGERKKTTIRIYDGRKTTVQLGKLLQ